MSVTAPSPLLGGDQVAWFERARLSRDSSFDGRFFSGVMSTGIYCRPICPAASPKTKNVVYFHSAAAAAQSGLKPCLVCRPESAPNSIAWAGSESCVRRALRIISAGEFNQQSTQWLAERLGITDRHLRRLFASHLGASPKSVATTQRLLFSRQLLYETNLPLAELALAAGFNNVRQFNTAFRNAFSMSPGDYRPRKKTAESQECLRLLLHYRPPYDWESLLAFLRARAIPGVEVVSDKTYQRVVGLNGNFGFIKVKQVPKAHCLQLEVQGFGGSLVRQVVSRVRAMFDVDACPAAVSEVLGLDPLLEASVTAKPGLRLPGAWDPFELLVRAILGQQISVKAARTLAARVVQCCGQPIPGEHLTHAFPTPEQLSEANLDNLGITTRRVQTLKSLAAIIAGGELCLAEESAADKVVKQLVAQPGIGPWTAEYVAMRGMSEPDAFPQGDLGLLKALRRIQPSATPKDLTHRAEAWRPWRAYAVMHLWNTL